MKMRLAAVVLLAGLLGACAKPVSFYAADRAARLAKVQACLSGGDADGQDCRNATQAEFDAEGVRAVNGRAVVR